MAANNSSRKPQKQKAKGFATDRRKINRIARVLAIVLIAAMILYFVIAANLFLLV